MKTKLKKPLTMITLGLSAAPFAFYELEVPFGVKFKLKSESAVKVPIEILDATSKNVLGKYDYLDLYNKETGYSIAYQVDLTTYDNYGIVDFLLGKNNNYLGQFYFVKEKPNLVLEGSTEPLEFQSYFYGKSSFPSTYIDATYITSSGGEITIKDDPEDIQICKDDKKVPFEEALKNWFNTISSTDLDSIRDTVMLLNNEPKDSTLTNDSRSQNSYELAETGKKMNRGLNAKALKLLAQSKILAVYGVFKGDEGKYSMVWGFAQDKDNPERKYHWITDLKDDFSKLIPDNNLDSKDNITGIDLVRAIDRLEFFQATSAAQRRALEIQNNSLRGLDDANKAPQKNLDLLRG